jgi:phasin family protein
VQQQAAPSARKGQAMVKNFEDAQNFSKDHFDATLKTFGAMSKGFQTIAVETAEYTKKAFEDGTSAAERLFAAKSLDKAVEVQSEYLKSVYEGLVSQTSKFGQLYADLAQEAYKPFENQWAKMTSVK